LDIHQSRTYVDIGSNHPINHSITYSLYRLGWCGLTIDGSDYAKLFAKYRPKDIFINKVVGEEDNIEVAFYTHCGGINLINQKDTPTNPQSYTKGTIKQININKELDRRGLTHIDFMNIDVEGAELEILKSFDFNTYNPSIIAVEIHGNNISVPAQPL